MGPGVPHPCVSLTRTSRHTDPAVKLCPSIGMTFILEPVCYIHQTLRKYHRLTVTGVTAGAAQCLCPSLKARKPLEIKMSFSKRHTITMLQTVSISQNVTCFFTCIQTTVQSIYSYYNMHMKHLLYVSNCVQWCTYRK